MIGAFADGLGLLQSLAIGLGLGGCLMSLRARRAAEPPPAPPLTAPAPPPAEPGLGEIAPLLEALPDPALLVDREGRVAGSNAAARRQLQFEASGLRLASILRHPELLDAAQAAAHDGVARTVEYETSAPVEEHFKAYVAPIEWARARAALMVFTNQTAMVATERMRADFLANASHELKTPLASLMLLLETISGPAKENPADVARFLEMMRAQAERMRRLVEDLLSLSRIELNEHVPPTGRIDMMAVALEAADASSVAATERGVRIEVIPGPPAWVVGDRFQIAQVLQNLIDNAVKYTPSGGRVAVEVGLGASRDEAVERASRRWPEEGARAALLTPPPNRAGRYAFARIEDQGPGIARRHLPRLGERFFRVERDLSADRSGTGLGLAIVKHIINRHRGGLIVESVQGRGAAFAVALQAVEAPAPSAASAEPATPQASRN